MTLPRKLSDFALAPNWITFGKALAAAIESPQDYGFDQHQQLQAAVAELRGVETSSLNNSLAAINWIERNAPEVLADENASFALTGVLLLAQISKTDNDLANRLGRRFFKGELRNSDLRIALEELQAQNDGRGVTAFERVKNVAAFEEAVFKMIKENPSKLGFSTVAQVIRCDRAARIPCDFVILENGKTVAGIEVKGHRTKTHRRYLLDNLAMTALIAREYQLGILIVPKSWGKAVDELSDLKTDLGLADVYIQVVEPGVGFWPAKRSEWNRTCSE